MSANITNQVAYLRTSREFPEDLKQLTVEVNKAYLDTANAVNARTIGLFSVNRPSITGNSWFVAGNRRQQTLRQVYVVTGAGNIAHGLNTTQIAGFVSITGTFTDGAVWYPLPYVNVVAANNQVSVVVNATNIVITVGAGSPPSVTSGYVVLEWLANV